MPGYLDDNGNPIAPAAQAKVYLDESGNPASPKAPASAPVQPTATIGAQIPTNAGPLQRAGNWLKNVAGDIRTGGTETLPGRALVALGAKGTDTGNSHAVGDFMASPVLGPLRTALGATQVASPRNPAEVSQGARNIGGGVMDTAQIPSAFVAPEAATALGNGLGRAAEMIPSTTRAGQNFQTVMQAAKNIPIDTSELKTISARAQQLGQRGATMPKVMGKLADALQPEGYEAGTKTPIKFASEPNPLVDATGRPLPPKVTVIPGKSPQLPDVKPITYGAGRDIASNAGRLSAADAMKTNPVMKGQVSLLAKALDTANRGAAEQAGMAKEYDAAMKEYRQAQQLKTAARAVVKPALGALGAAGAYEFARKALGSR